MSEYQLQHKDRVVFREERMIAEVYSDEGWGAEVGSLVCTSKSREFFIRKEAKRLNLRACKRQSDPLLVFDFYKKKDKKPNG